LVESRKKPVGKKPFLFSILFSIRIATRKGQPAVLTQRKMIAESLRDWFVESALNWKEKEAVSFLREGYIETEISYRRLNEDSNRLADILLNAGVRKGDRVILFLEKSLFAVVSHLAVQKTGAVAVPLNPGFKKSEMSYLVNDADAKLVLTGSSQEPMIKEIDPELRSIVVPAGSPYQEINIFRTGSDVLPQIAIYPEDPGLIIYTSGTTGRPKGAVLTQRNLVHDAGNIIKLWEIETSDVLCHALPLFHVHGLCFALHPILLAGAHVIMLDRFSPKDVIEVLTKKPGAYACTVFMAVPSMYSKMLDQLGGEQTDFGHIRLWTSGSAPLLVRDFERIEKAFGKEPVEREGMSETGINFSNPIKGMRKPGSIGLALPDLEVRIVDLDTLEDVVPGQVGEIWLKGPAVTPGYWRKPEETARAFEKGWFRTGDLGRIDEEGYYYLTDRIKHIIISGGENISPKEIEGVVNQLEDVVESCVVGIPDEQWGEKVVAVVVPKPGSGLTSDDIKTYCGKHLHDWKCPKEFIFWKELPKNTMGKVLKEELVSGLAKRHETYSKN
jgi:malonyl-CoA/methylmalonyl-CoA synthetase